MTTDEERIEVLITKIREGELSKKEKEEMLEIIALGGNDALEKDQKEFLNKLTDSVLRSCEQSINNLNNQITFIQEIRAGNVLEAVKRALEIIIPQEKNNESK